VNQGLSLGLKLGLPRAQAAALAKLRTPEKIQDFVSALAINFEPDGDTCLSVTEALKQRRAHCIEGAFIAACALWLNGMPPLVMDLQAKGDCDHVVTVFRRGKCWGAISKSNHVWLRWRDPVYRSLRELTMSYFHEYVLGPKKTLWAYSSPIDLRRFDPKLWITNPDDCWDVAAALDSVRHYKIITPKQRKLLRLRDSVEVNGAKVLQYKAPNKHVAQRY
jgi:hypothetical protein